MISSLVNINFLAKFLSDPAKKARLFLSARNDYYAHFQRYGKRCEIAVHRRDRAEAYQVRFLEIDLA